MLMGYKMPNGIISIDIVLNSLTIVAGLALSIERTIEILKHSIQFAGKTSEQGIEIEQEDSQLAAAREKLTELEKILKEMDSNNGVLKKASLGEPIGVSVESPDPLIAESETQGSDDFEEYQAFKLIPAESKPREQTQKILFYQLAGLGFGIMAADIFSIQLLSLFLSPLGADVTNSIPTLLDTFLSGVVIGGGSQPVHALIRLISERKVDISSIEATPVAKMVAEPQVESNIQPHIEQLQKPPYQWQPIIYSGGVKPLSLEGRNRRGGNPIKIIYHHTAMHDHKSFQDIVNEFLVTKGWSTGYHSVIMPDGKVEPFCRWDRVGNHAKGNNNRTLGVSFHGNFHTLENDKFSNATGAFGAQEPSEAQINAGARQIALWAQLYELDIELDVLPHKDVLPGHTVCPGSNFPHSLLKQKIAFYYGLLAGNEFAKADLSQLKESPYVYV